MFEEQIGQLINSSVHRLLVSFLFSGLCLVVAFYNNWWLKSWAYPRLLAKVL